MKFLVANLLNWNTKKQIGFLILFFLIAITFKGHAQADEFIFENASVGLNSADIKLLKEGRVKFLQTQYADALALFEAVSNKNQVYLNYLKGICYSHDADNKQQALILIQAIREKESEINGYDFNLAFAYVKNDSIQAAIITYKKALVIEENKGLKNDVLINEINLSLQHCYNILDLKGKKSFVTIQSLGAPINTKADEYCPLIPSNGEFMIYTYRGPKAKGGKQKVKGSKIRNIDDVELFYEDVFISKKLNDTLWSEPEGINTINSNSHDAAVSLNSDGSELFIYRNRGDGKGDLYLSELEGTTWSKPILQLRLNSPEWDGSACFIPNEDKIIFSSERKGGFGGKDLYSAERVKNNMWANIKNLGPEINSKFDEDAPFVTSDGRILFFASNNKNSFGGYDIFRCDLINGDWQSPYNLGSPINTTNDDNYFTVAGDGKVAYYSSYKKGGDGGQDIYKVEPGIPGRPLTLLQVEGLVSLNGKPIAAEVEIKSVLNNKGVRFKIKANSVTGKFLSNLATGDEYELLVSIDQFAPQLIKLSTMNVDSFVVLSVFAEFNSPAYVTTLEAKDKTPEEKSLTEKTFDVNSFSNSSGDIKIENLKFTVQIAAFKFSENFNYNGIVGMPKIIRKMDKDGVSRFTMGSFDTYNQAFALLRNLQKSNIKDAFITAVFEGERRLLSDLVQSKIIK
jgi:tetratricopeptide (TPR) repeat protein